MNLVLSDTRKFGIAMLKSVQLEQFVQKIACSGYPLEHWASSLLRREGWSVTTNRYYVDSDDKKPREMDIVAFKETYLERFKVRTILLVSCKKSENSVWGFLRRPFPVERNQINLFPVMVTSKVPSVNYSLRDWKWRADFCHFMAEGGLLEWFGIPRHDVFAHQQLPLSDKGKIHDADMHSATMQLIKAQAYEIAGHHTGNSREVTQFNLVSLTEGDFVGFNFCENDSIVAEEISEQVALASYNVDNSDHESRIIYLTKASFGARVSLFTNLHRLNVEFFVKREEKFRDGAIYDIDRRNIFIDEFSNYIKDIILGRTRSFCAPPYVVPKIQVSLHVGAPNMPIISILAYHPEVLEAARSPYIKEQLARALNNFWGYAGEFELKFSADE
jgi:hypothetical protein